MTEDISTLTITHAGTGGYKERKPLPTPIQKLTKYSKENNVKLNDLFLVFDKKKHGYLTEEEFRASLKVSSVECIFIIITCEITSLIETTNS